MIVEVDPSVTATAVTMAEAEEGFAEFPNASWTVGKLRGYLRDRGGRLSSVKSELVKR